MNRQLVTEMLLLHKEAIDLLKKPRLKRKRYEEIYNQLNTQGYVSRVSLASIMRGQIGRKIALYNHINEIIKNLAIIGAKTEQIYWIKLLFSIISVDILKEIGLDKDGIQIILYLLPELFTKYRDLAFKLAPIIDQLLYQTELSIQVFPLPLQVVAKMPNLSRKFRPEHIIYDPSDQDDQAILAKWLLDTELCHVEIAIAIISQIDSQLPDKLAEVLTSHQLLSRLDHKLQTIIFTHLSSEQAENLKKEDFHAWILTRFRTGKPVDVEQLELVDPDFLLDILHDTTIMNQVNAWVSDRQKDFQALIRSKIQQLDPPTRVFSVVFELLKVCNPIVWHDFEFYWSILCDAFRLKSNGGFADGKIEWLVDMADFLCRLFPDEREHALTIIYSRNKELGFVLQNMVDRQVNLKRAYNDIERLENQIIMSDYAGQRKVLTKLVTEQILYYFMKLNEISSRITQDISFVQSFQATVKSLFKVLNDFGLSAEGVPGEVRSFDDELFESNEGIPEPNEMVIVDRPAWRYCSHDGVIEILQKGVVRVSGSS